jgi:uncharacterized protein (TIGR02145 family)
MNIKKMFQIILSSGVLILTSCKGEQSMDSVKIGNQEWLVSNLNTSEFQNGEKIFQAKNEKEWILALNEQRAAWCYYKFNEVNESRGKMYNWYAATDTRLIAPKGWHVANAGEHYTLYKNMNKSAANASKNPKLIEFYNIPPGILRGGNCEFYDFDNLNISFLWTSSEINGYGQAVIISNNTTEYDNYREFFKDSGLYIKCVKNIQ